MEEEAGSKPRSLRSVLPIVLAAMAPILLAWAYKTFWNPRPLWAFYFDPETIYYHEGRRILQGILPLNVDNPGTPLQLLSALLITLTNTFDPMEIRRFLVTGYVVAAAAKVATAYVVVRTLFRDQPMGVQIIAIWTPFLAPHVLEYDTVWSPETFYFVAGGLTVAALARHLRVEEMRTLAVAGAALGVAISLKLTFLAWVPALVITAAVLGRRQLIRTVAVATAAITMGFTLGVLPVLPKVPETASRFLTFAQSAQIEHGGAESKSFTITEGLSNVARAAGATLPWHAWLLLLLALAVAASRGDGEARLLTIFGIIALSGTYVLASRHGVLRYFSLAGPGAIALVAAAARGQLARRASYRTLLVTICGLMLAWELSRNIRQHDARIANVARLRSITQTAIARGGVNDPVIVYAWHYPEPSFALRSLAYDEGVYRRVEEFFPRHGHYDVWTKKLHLPAGASHWDYLIIRGDDFAALEIPRGPRYGKVGEYLIVRGAR